MKKNSLDFIFQKQIDLNNRLGVNLDSMNDDERREWMIKFYMAANQEMAELIDSLNWKWWKKGSDDWDNVKVELIDILHFWVSMCTITGMSAEDVFDLYRKKNKLNHDRQDGGYKEGDYQKVKDGVEDNRSLFENV